MPHHLFISYSAHDKTAAGELCAALESHGLKCWLAPRDLAGAGSRRDEIAGVIDAIPLVILVFSNPVNRSKRIREEIRRAAARRIPIIGFRIENVDPQDWLKRRIESPRWLDAVSPPQEASLADLAKMAKALLGPLAPSEPAAASVPDRTSHTPRKWITREILIGGGSWVIGLLILIGFIAGMLHRRSRIAPPRASPSPVSGEARVRRLHPKTPGHWIVGPAGSAESDSTDLAEVLRSALVNDTVLIRSGTCAGGVVISRPVHLIGAGERPAKVLLQSGGKDVVTVTSKGVSIENLRIGMSGAGADRALVCSDGAALRISDSVLESTGTFCVVIAGTSAFQAENCRFTTFGRGSAFQADDAATGELNHCAILKNRWGISANDAAHVHVADCSLDQNGLASGEGAVVSVSGIEAAIRVERSQFTRNPASIVVNGGGEYFMSDSSLQGNGVGDDSLNAGLLTVTEGSAAELTGVAIRSNRQGLAAENGGVLHLTRCKFSDNGMRTADEKLAFYCRNIAVNGTNSSLTLAACEFAGSRAETILVNDGATASVTDSTFQSGKEIAMRVGTSGFAPSSAELVGVRFLDNETIGLRVVAGSHATVRNSQFVENRSSGIVVQDPESTVTVGGSLLRGNGEYGICVYDQAAAELSNTTMEGNGRGAQAGILSSGTQHGALTLENCVVSANRVCGIAVCAQSVLSLKGCRISGNGNHDVWTEAGGTVRNEEENP